MYLGLCFVDRVGQFIGHFLASDYHTWFPSFLYVLILMNRLTRPGFLFAVRNLFDYLQLNLEHPKLTEVRGSDHCLHPQATAFSKVPENCSFLLKPQPFPETSSCSLLPLEGLMAASLISHPLSREAWGPNVHGTRESYEPLPRSEGTPIGIKNHKIKPYRRKRGKWNILEIVEKIMVPSTLSLCIWESKCTSSAAEHLP